MEKALKMVMYARPWSFPMTMISLCIGLMAAVIDGARPPVFLVLGVMIGGILFHASANLWNDYFDYRKRVDVPGAPTTRYREHPVISGGMKERSLLVYALSLGLAGLALGVIAFLVLGNPWVPALCAVGAFAAYAYTGPPVEAKYRALGEPMVFAVWGLLFPLGAYVTATGAFGAEVLALAAPFGILVAAVLTANNTRDVEYDASTRVKTLSTILGRERSLWLLRAELLGAYALQLVLVAAGVYPLPAALTVLSFPVAIRVIRAFSVSIPDNADPLVATVTLLFGVLHVAGLTLSLVA